MPQIARCDLLLGFFVLVVTSAIPAVLADVESVWIIFFVLHGCVISSLTLTTSQSNDDSVVFLGHCPSS